jgi:hypothetical protein
VAPTAIGERRRTLRYRNLLVRQMVQLPRLQAREYQFADRMSIFFTPFIGWELP